MARRASPLGKIRVHTDPNDCKNFFENLKYVHNSQGTGVGTLPIRDELSWAVQKCPDGVDSLADVLGIKREEEFEISMGRTGPRQLVAPAYDWIELTQPATTPSISPTTSTIASPIATDNFSPITLATVTATLPPTAAPTNVPHAPGRAAEMGSLFALVFGPFFGIIALIALALYLKKAADKREIERVARLRRSVNPEEARRAEERVRNEWARLDQVQREREEAVELQSVTMPQPVVKSYVHVPVQSEQAYRHPRMDWKK